MNVVTHQEDPRIARIHYLDYRKQVAAHREERKKRLEEAAKKSRSALYWARKEKDQLADEDRELMEMYKAMSQGKRVLVLGEVFRSCGTTPRTDLPILALARADWEYTWFEAGRGKAHFSCGMWKRSKGECLSMPRSFFSAEVTNLYWRSQNGRPSYPIRALVPSIPARLRPENLKKYWIMWEAEWDVSPPKDPILLSRLGQYTFSVVAQWDLTPVERSVLFGRPS
jgi:hypothetical protein